MSRAFAFFDVDDTLIRIKSMFDFYKFWALEWHQDASIYQRFEATFQRLRWEQTSREILNRTYYRNFAGIEAHELDRAGAAWAAHHLADPDALFVGTAVRRLNELRGQGIEPVFVSGSFAAVLRPIAHHLDVHHSLNVRMSVAGDGLLTGEIEYPQTIGEGKATAIRHFMNEQSANPKLCYAFGDDVSDLPMLRTVGRPGVVGVGNELTICAQELNWEILEDN